MLSVDALLTVIILFYHIHAISDYDHSMLWGSDHALFQVYCAASKGFHEVESQVAHSVKNNSSKSL